VSCKGPGETEAVQFNAGVILFDLVKLRAIEFTERIVDLAHHTARMAGVNKPATWGDQDFLSNYFRFHPEVLDMLPCGCNYQWTAARRGIKCPAQPVRMGHGWHAGTAERTTDPYNKLFHHFKTCENASECASGPEKGFDKSFRVSMKHRASPPYPIAFRSTGPRCPHQTSMACDEDLSAPLFRHDVVNVLTRSAMRPNFFLEARASVKALVHRHVRHVVVTDDPASLAYITGDQVVEIPSRYREFDAMEPCDRCGASPDKGCGNAPYEPVARRSFLDCYCNTSYPMNSCVVVSLCVVFVAHAITLHCP
jgi:hypothetical protein